MPIAGCGSQRTASTNIWFPGPDGHSLPWHSAHPAKVMTCKTIAPNVLADELGHQVRILGRTGILHSFAGREIQIGSEILAAANLPCLGKANGLGLVPFLRMLAATEGLITGRNWCGIIFNGLRDFGVRRFDTVEREMALSRIVCKFWCQIRFCKFNDLREWRGLNCAPKCAHRSPSWKGQGAPCQPVPRSRLRCANCRTQVR